MARVDVFTEIRVASYGGLTDHLITPESIWADPAPDHVAVIDGKSPSGDGYIKYIKDGWSGLDMPEYDISYTPLADGFGEREQSRAIKGREITTPIIADIVDKENLEKLKNILSSKNRALLGFKRDPQSESRYLPLCRYRSGLDRPNRGYQPWSEFPITFKSEFPFMISPQVSPVGSSANITTSGVDDRICWGVHFTAPAAQMSVGILLGGLHNFSLSSVPSSFLYIAGGPYYGFKGLNADGSVNSAVRRTTDTGFVSPYLESGGTYQIQLTGGTGKIFWLKNFEGA